jgi:hypothetical protein
VPQKPGANQLETWYDWIMVKNNGTIVFESHTQEMLWRCEIKGQLSDGMWENSRPWGHARFWLYLESDTCVLGEKACVTSDGYARKVGYNLTGLIKYVGDRMVAYGRMALAGGDEDACRAAEYMPDTLEEWERRLRDCDWQYSSVANQMVAVDHELASLFYGTLYHMKDLRKDLREIKRVMKTAKSW